MNAERRDGERTRRRQRGRARGQSGPGHVVRTKSGVRLANETVWKQAMGRRWGQHFLHSQAVLARIVEAARLTPGEPVLEIGPGQGALTRRLLATGARVTAVEVDPVLLHLLREQWPAAPHLRLIGGDILKVDLSSRELFGEELRYAVIANLPYYLSTPLLFRLMSMRQRLDRLLLMVQKEIANRLVALPADGKTYGALSVAAHHCFTMERLFTVPPEAFRPAPKVDSAVVHFRPREPCMPPGEEAAFLEHVKMLFTGRRKMMVNQLRRLYPANPPERAAGVEATLGQRRPEALDPGEHLAIYRALFPGSSGDGPSRDHC